MLEEEVIAERLSPLAMSGDEFRRLGYQLVDRIASFLDSLPERKVTPAVWVPIAGCQTEVRMRHRC